MLTTERRRWRLSAIRRLLDGAADDGRESPSPTSRADTAGRRTDDDPVDG